MCEGMGMTTERNMEIDTNIFNDLRGSIGNS